MCVFGVGSKLAQLRRKPNMQTVVCVHHGDSRVSCFHPACISRRYQSQGLMDDISSKGIMSLSQIDSKIAFRGASKKTGRIFYSLFQISFHCQDLKSHPCHKLATCWLENKVQMWHGDADDACLLCTAWLINCWFLHLEKLMTSLLFLYYYETIHNYSQPGW